MRQKFRKVTLFFLIVFFSQQAFSQGNIQGQASTDQKSINAKIFVNSCLYGTMAGALIGAGSLAFADNPRDKLQRIFRGASLGLYAGILLGAYLVYGVDSSGAEEQRLDQLGNPEVGFIFEKPSIYPLLSEKGIEGAMLDLTIFKF